ncbi:unnamed protein product [Rhizoctonia solani]|uniref:Protein kinase domain-containing protein n=1 Tax=Rhizoctonia solani TaxID=456999 RepID=A0A8H3HE38_9AGAM|nr:unnamed protein product [Rhizoctonia solani]
MRQANFLSSYPVPTVRRGHTDRVTSVSFSPDGQLVASSSGDMLIRIWDARRPSQRSKVFKGHTNTITSVAYSPLGDMLASGSWDQTVRIWDTSTRLEICEPLEGHNNCVTSVDFSPNSKLVASGSDDKTIRLWDVQSGTSISDPFEGHTSWVKSVVFSPDGTRIGSSSNDGTIRIWGTEHGRTVVGPLKGHINCVNSIAFSPDGSQIISGSQDSTLRLWDIRIRGQVGDPYKGHTSWVTSVAFSPDSMHYVASGSRDNTIRVWDIRMGRRVFAPFEEHESSVTSVAISPSGLQLASGSNDWSVMVWHLPVYDSKAESDTQSELEEDTGQSDSDDGDWHLIGQHMVIQDMFELLASHGCVDLTPKMDINQDTAILMSGGGFGDIWRGELLDGTKVAIKAWRDSLVEHCDYKTLKRATREIYYWSKMRHENVHELMGVLLFKGQSLGMVSEWMENGNLHEYLRKNPDTDRYQMASIIGSC